MKTSESLLNSKCEVLPRLRRFASGDAVVVELQDEEQRPEEERLELLHGEKTAFLL